MMGFSINATANGHKAYLRNFAYHTTANLLPNGTYDARHPIGEVEDPEVTDEKDDFLNKLMIGSKAVSVKDIIILSSIFISQAATVSESATGLRA